MTQFTDEELKTAYRVLFNFPKQNSVDYVMRWINENTKEEMLLLFELKKKYKGKTQDEIDEEQREICNKCDGDCSECSIYLYKNGGYTN